MRKRAKQMILTTPLLLAGCHHRETMRLMRKQEKTADMGEKAGVTLNKKVEDLHKDYKKTVNAYNDALQLLLREDLTKEQKNGIAYALVESTSGKGSKIIIKEGNCMVPRDKTICTKIDRVAKLANKSESDFDEANQLANKVSNETARAQAHVVQTAVEHNREIDRCDNSTIGIIANALPYLLGMVLIWKGLPLLGGFLKK